MSDAAQRRPGPSPEPLAASPEARDALPAHPDDKPPRELSVTGQRWRRQYARRLALTDFVVLVLATAAATGLRFGSDFLVEVEVTDRVSPTYVSVGILIIVAWSFALGYFRTREPKIVAEGTDEYVRIGRATFAVFGLIAIVSLLAQTEISRSYLAITLPLGLIGLVVGRKVWRVWLAKQRAKGHHTISVLVIGGTRSAARIHRTLRGVSGIGYRVTGVWVPDRPARTNEWLDVPDAFIPVLGTDRSLAGALAIADADAVIVTNTEHLGHDGLKSLAWELEGSDIDLMVSPHVIDVAGPRIHVRAVANMPFIHLEEPQYGTGRVSKVVFDTTLATLALVALSPILLVTALAVKLSSPGPVIYRSQRIGVHGTPFDMLKFRSMRVDADQQLHALTHANEGAGPLFKMQEDPRVTRVGRFIRRYSIDELPQLINVVKGEMSLVGPRPPLPHEVEEYGEDVARRLLVRQGLTGLWQVSGRSDLTWEESVRLDLDYVENWSMLRDLQIIWRTVRAVLGSRGAY